MQHEKINIIQADYSTPEHRQLLAEALIAYSSDPMGGGKALSTEHAQKSIELLAEKSYAFSFLAFHKDTCAGFCNCFEAVSTFTAQCIANIHDLAVLAEFRGLGISQALLNAVEDYSRKNNYSKITLEVLGGNTVAMNAYRKFGFEAYQLDPEAGQALFWQKLLQPEPGQ